MPIDDNDIEREELPAGSLQTVERPEEATKTPSFYKVLILNDDFTPRDFVVHVLKRFFRKDENEATRLMLEVHHRGVGIAGVFTFEIAETKVYQVNEYSRQHHHPLKCVAEKANK